MQRVCVCVCVCVLCISGLRMDHKAAVTIIHAVCHHHTSYQQDFWAVYPLDLLSVMLLARSPTRDSLSDVFSFDHVLTRHPVTQTAL